MALIMEAVSSLLSQPVARIAPSPLSPLRLQTDKKKLGKKKIENECKKNQARGWEASAVSSSSL